MPKEILLYSAVYSYIAESVITQLEESRDTDVRFRINSPGGVVQDWYGIFAKSQEHPKVLTLAVDGQASSGAAFWCCYVDDVECLDVSKFMFHRAAMASYYENNPEYFTDEVKKMLTDMNKQLRAAMESKFTAAEWLAVTGVSLDDLFSLESRIDVSLDAKQAKKLGIVKRINPITPKKKMEIEALAASSGIAAFAAPVHIEDHPTPTEKAKANHIMTLAEFQAQHPAIFAEAVQTGVAQERDRVGAFLVYNDVDPEAVAAGITAGGNISQTQMATFARKALSMDKLAALETESAAPLATAEVPKPGAKPAPEVEAFQKELEALQGKPAAN